MWNEKAIDKKKPLIKLMQDMLTKWLFTSQSQLRTFDYTFQNDDFFWVTKICCLAGENKRANGKNYVQV